MIKFVTSRMFNGEKFYVTKNKVQQRKDNYIAWHSESSR